MKIIKTQNNYWIWYLLEGEQEQSAKNVFSLKPWKDDFIFHSSSQSCLGPSAENCGLMTKLHMCLQMLFFFFLHQVDKVVGFFMNVKCFLGMCMGIICLFIFAKNGLGHSPV